MFVSVQEGERTPTASLRSFSPANLHHANLR